MQPLSRWSRRRFLQAAGITGMSAALAPFVPSLRASASPPARRLVCFGGPMGSALDAWRDNGSAPFVSGAALPALSGPVLGALAGLESRLAILDGVDLASVYTSMPGDPSLRSGAPSHGRRGDADFVGPYGMAGHLATTAVFTGTGAVPTAPFEPAQWQADFAYLSATGPSLDTYVHERQRADAPWLQTAALNCYEAYPDQRSVQNVASYGTPTSAGAAAPWNYPTTDPRAIFDRLFGSLGAGSSDRRTLGRRRVLDQVRGEMTRLRAELPAEDRERLDAHHESLARLDATLGGSGAACSVPPAPDSRTEWATRAHPLETARDMYEVVRLAFECDLMRSVSFMCGTETQGDDPRYWVPWAPGPDVVGTLHQVSHDQAQPDRREIMIAYNRAQVSSFADLIRALQRGANTFADTIVAWGGIQSDTVSHVSLNPIWMVAAGENTPIRTNQYLRWGSYDSSWVTIPRGGIPHNRVLTTLAQAMGYADVTTFGSTTTPSGCGYEDDGYSYVCPTTAGLDHRPIPELVS